MAESGFLIPPGYVSERPSESNMNDCSIIWGFSLCCAVFTCAKASQQTWLAYRRRKRLNAYIYMVWAEWSASVTISVISWLFLKGTIPPRLVVGYSSTRGPADADAFTASGSFLACVSITTCTSGVIDVDDSSMCVGCTGKAARQILSTIAHLGPRFNAFYKS